jgi:hypothetical protein
VLVNNVKGVFIVISTLLSAGVQAQTIANFNSIKSANLCLVRLGFVPYVADAPLARQVVVVACYFFRSLSSRR